MKSEEKYFTIHVGIPSLNSTKLREYKMNRIRSNASEKNSSIPAHLTRKELSKISQWLGAKQILISKTFRSIWEKKSYWDVGEIQKELEALKKILFEKSKKMDRLFEKRIDLKHLCTLTFVPQKRRENYLKEIEQIEEQLSQVRDEWILITSEIDHVRMQFQGTELENCKPIKELNSIQAKISSQLEKIK